MNDRLTTRNKNMISGAIGFLLLFAGVAIGIKGSFGAFEGGYRLTGTFAAAGQGLLPGSDVKIRGVNVGEVRSIELVDNRAVITLRIQDGTKVPVDARAVIRPKTLFGEKFVDLLLGDNETSGPFLADGDEIADTLGGFELEQVLTDTYPVLAAVDPTELAIVIDQLAAGADGVGEAVNRSLVNGATLSQLSVDNDAEFRQFLTDLADLAEALDVAAPSLAEGAADLNVVLPTLNRRGEEITGMLGDLSRIAGDVADVLDENRSLTETALTGGTEALEIMFDRRSQIQPLLLGLTQYTETIATAIRIEVGDGTLMAAVKSVLVVSDGGSPLPVEGPGGAAGAGSDGAPGPDAGVLDDLTGLTRSTRNAIFSLLTGGVEQ